MRLNPTMDYLSLNVTPYRGRGFENESNASGTFTEADLDDFAPLSKEECETMVDHKHRNAKPSKRTKRLMELRKLAARKLKYGI